MSEVECDTAYGRMRVLDNDAPRGEALVRTGRAPDHDEIEKLAATLGPGSIAVDAGANFGCFSLAFALRGAEVHAFEPQRLIAGMLRASRRMNSLGRISIYEVALGAGAGWRSLDQVDYSDHRDFGTVRARAGCEYHSTQVIPLDYFKLPHVDLLKVDVEGMEADVLRGAAETIARCRPLIYVEHDHSDAVELRALVESFGYSVEASGGRDWLCTPRRT